MDGGITDRSGSARFPDDGVDEAALLDGLRAGDESAAETFVRHYGPRMQAVARRFSRDDAEVDDIVQDAMISAVRSIDRFEGDARLSTWLHRITVNSALMRRRKRASRPEASIDDLLPTFGADGHRVVRDDPWTAGDEATPEREETRAMIRELIDELPDGYRNVLALRDIEGLDTRATGEILGVSKAVVKTRLHRARMALRELIEERLRDGAVGGATAGPVDER